MRYFRYFTKNYIEIEIILKTNINLEINKESNTNDNLKIIKLKTLLI